MSNMTEGLVKRNGRGGKQIVKKGDVTDAKLALANHDSYRDTYFIMGKSGAEHVGTLYLWRVNLVPRAEAKGVFIMYLFSNTEFSADEETGRPAIGSYETVAFDYGSARDGLLSDTPTRDKRTLLVNKLMIANRNALDENFGIDLSYITEDSEPDTWIPAFLKAGFTVHHVALDPDGAIGGDGKW